MEVSSILHTSDIIGEVTPARNALQSLNLKSNIDFVNAVEGTDKYNESRKNRKELTDKLRLSTDSVLKDKIDSAISEEFDKLCNQQVSSLVDVRSETTFSQVVANPIAVSSASEGNDSALFSADPLEHEIGSVIRRIKDRLMSPPAA